MSKSASLPRIRSKARPASQRPRLVEHELERAQVRIRTVDSLYSISLLVGGILTYVLLVIGLDYWLHLGDGTRQLLWCLAGLGALTFIGIRLVLPLISTINPYYTARMIERATPGSKNGIINWLDLEHELVNPVIRDALSRRAVHELDSANMEEAIPTRKPVRIAVIIGVILLAIIGFAFFIPDQVGSLFKRALFPFKPAIIPTHTRIEVLNPVVEPEPDADVATLPIKEVEVERGQPVEFRVLTHGQIPSEVVLESQTVGDKQPVVKPLRQDKKDDGNQPWRVALSSSDIPVDGFVFWFRANDGLTRKFKLVVVSRTPPSVSDLDVRLNFPAYTKRRPVSQGMGPIKAIEGTTVDILVTADRPASSGELTVIEEKTVEDNHITTTSLQTIKLVRPQGISDDNKLALEHQLSLIPGYFKNEDNRKYFYQLTLISPETLTGTSPKYPLDVLPDLAPRVEIKKVKEIILDKKQDEFEVETNAVVPIAGQAHDDIAMGQVALKLKTSDGRDLFFVGTAPTEKNMQKANGFTPPPVNFLLKLDLAKLSYDDDPKTAKPIQLKPGTLVELVVEGSDTAEPKPHVGTSQLIKLKIKDKASEEERKNQEKKADDQQQKHEQEKKDKEQQQPENNQGEKSDKPSGDKSDKPSGDKNDKQQGEKSDKPSGDKSDKPSGEKNDKQQGEKSDKPSGDKSDKPSGEKNDKQQGEKSDKPSGDKSDKPSGEKNDKQQGEKSDKPSGDKSDKPSGDKNDKQQGEKSDKPSGDKSDKPSGEKNDKQQGEKSNKPSGDKSDKPSGDKNDKQQGEKSDKPSGDKSDKPSGDKNDKQQGEKSDKPSGDKSDKPSGDKNDKQQGEKSDKPSGDKSDKPSGDKNDKQQGQKSDKPSGDKSDKPSGDKNDKQQGEKSDKPSGDKSDKPSGDKNDKQQGEKSDKPSGDKSDKPSGDKNDKQQGEKSDKPSGDKSDKPSGDKNDKQQGEKSDKPSGDKSDKPSGDKNDKQQGEKSDKPSGDKSDKPSGDKNDKQQGEKSDKPSGDKSDKPSGDKNDKQQGEKSDKPSGDKSDKPSGDKNDKQQGEKSDKPSGDKSDKPSGDKNDKQQGEKSGKQTNEKTDDPKTQTNEKPGSDKGLGGGGNGKDPNDKGDLSKLMEQLAKDKKPPEKVNFNPKAAESNDKTGQDVDNEAAQKRNLALDTLADKLRRGDIDRQLADKLKELKLTKEEALKLVQNQKIDRVKSTGKQAEQAPGKSLTGFKKSTEQIIDPANDPPDELSSSYRSFTEKRNQPKK